MSDESRPEQWALELRDSIMFGGCAHSMRGSSQCPECGALAIERAVEERTPKREPMPHRCSGTIAAERMATAIHRLVYARVIGERSAAADAALDWRDPIASDSDGVVRVSDETATLRSRLERAEAALTKLLGWLSEPIDVALRQLPPVHPAGEPIGNVGVYWWTSFETLQEIVGWRAALQPEAPAQGEEPNDG